jgi:hypothetical protein
VRAGTWWGGENENVAQIGERLKFMQEKCETIRMKM